MPSNTRFGSASCQRTLCGFLLPLCMWLQNKAACCTGYVQLTVLLLQGGDRCGKSTNFWEYYEADIERAVSLNSTCFRLSLGALTFAQHAMAVMAFIAAQLG